MLDRQGQPAPALTTTGSPCASTAAPVTCPGRPTPSTRSAGCLSQLGDHQQALVHCRQALPCPRARQPPRRHHLDSLGYAHHHLGHHTEAITCYRQALDMFREIGDRYNQAKILTHLGDTYHAAGHPPAHTAWHQALAILDDLHHPDAEQVRAKLSNITAPAPAEPVSHSAVAAPPAQLPG